MLLSLRGKQLRTDRECSLNKDWWFDASREQRQCTQLFPLSCTSGSRKNLKLEGTCNFEKQLFEELVAPLEKYNTPPSALVLLLLFTVANEGRKTFEKKQSFYSKKEALRSKLRISICRFVHLLFLNANSNWWHSISMENNHLSVCSETPACTYRETTQGAIQKLRVQALWSPSPLLPNKTYLVMCICN